MIVSMRRQTAVLLAVVLALVGLAGSPATASQGDQSPVTAIVSLTAGASTSALHGVHIVSQLPRLGAVVVSGTESALRSLRGRSGIRGITPNYKLRPTSNDNNPGSDSVYAGTQLGGRVATDGAGAGVTVAVVDTGVSDTPSLNRASGRLIDGLDASGTGSVADGFGHGTFMANLVAGGRAPGSGNNTLGVAPAADVVNVKVADSNGDTSLDQVLFAFSWVDYFADHIDILEFAFSGPRPGSAYGPDPLTDAVERLRADGVLVVVASGNVAGELGDPGFDPYALTVGAADLRRSARPHVADFSGYGDVYGVSKPDVVASGVGVLSIMPADSTIARANPQSLQPNGLYRGSGTSQSTAITAGLAATVLQRYPNATPADLKATLRSTANPIDGAGSGQGVVKVPQRLFPADARGHKNAGTGEGDLDTAAWLAHSWLDGAWVEANNAAWDAQTWRGQTWRGQTWGAQTWRGQTWRGQTWLGQTWLGQTWLAQTWQGQTWSAQTWAAQSWRAQSWGGQLWAARAWS
ncbi:MAG: serine protease AprX [Frankiaceae bacterium]|nr:serine protease AprX [Frankiaceae bacterium]